MIALIDRLAAYAAREAESEDPEETKRQEEAAARRLAEKVKTQKAVRAARENGAASHTEYGTDEGWGASAPTSPVTEKSVPEAEVNGVTNEVDAALAERVPESSDGNGTKKFRGVPEDVQLFEVFWRQVVELIKVCIYPSSWFGLLMTDWCWDRRDRTCRYKISLPWWSP